MRKIMLIAASTTPIPATRGGATETMMSHLIDVNEIEKKVQFVICSYYDEEAEKLSHNYKNSKFCYYYGNYRVDDLCLLPYRVLRKVSGGRTYLCSNFIRWCVKRIKEEQPDCILVEGNHFQVLQLSRETSLPIILHMHIDGLNITTDNGKRIVNACKGVIVISEFCAKRVCEIDAFQSQKVYVLKNTIDVDHFKCEKDDFFKKQFYRRNGLEKDDKGIMYCGRLDDQKGIGELLEAFIKIEQEGLYLLVIGSSAYKDGKKNAFVRELENRAAKSGKKIIFTGYVSQNELPKYFSLPMISVVPSKCQEAAGNVIIESLACELPVVATKRGGIPEYADESACLLVDCDSFLVEHLRMAIERLIFNPDVYLKKKKSARAISLQYDKNHYYSEFIRVVNSIVE